MPVMLVLEFTPVTRYDLTENGVLPVLSATPVELDLDSAVIDLTTSLDFSVDITDARATFARIGKLRFSVHNHSRRWSPGYFYLGASDRDHRVRVMWRREGADDIVLWNGFVREVKEKTNLVVEFNCAHVLDRLDDALILRRRDTGQRGEIEMDDDGDITFVPDRGAVATFDPADPNRILSATVLPDTYAGQLNSQNWASWNGIFEYLVNIGVFEEDPTPRAYGSTEAPTIWLPDNDAPARDFVSGMLSSFSKVLVPDERGILRQREFGPNYARVHDNTLTALPPTMKIEVLDPKSRMYNYVTYAATGPTFSGDFRTGWAERGDEENYYGDRRFGEFPESYRRRHGARRLDTDWQHLNYTDARLAARRILEDSVYPVKRLRVEMPMPDAGIQIGDIFNVRLDDSANWAFVIEGEFWVSGYKVDIKEWTVMVTLVEMQNRQSAVHRGRALFEVPAVIWSPNPGF